MRKTLQDDPVQGRPFRLCSEGAGSYDVFAVTSTRQRTRAYRLAADLYAQAGLAKPDSEYGLAEPYDGFPETLTLLAEDAQGREAATMSLVCDGPRGLPADAVFPVEVAQLRGQQRRLAEGVRLAIHPEHLFAEDLFRGMLQLLYLYATRIRSATDLLVEINPRHVAFYRRSFGFEVLGPERPCPRVNGAPARLLLLTQGASAIDSRRRAEGPLAIQRAREESPFLRSGRSLTGCGPDAAEAVRWLRAAHAPMSRAQRSHFLNGAAVAAAAEAGAER